MKFLTEELTTFLNGSSRTKKERKLERKQSSASAHWFGMLPFAIRTYLKKRK